MQDSNRRLEILDRICGLIYGQALGDAFGLTTEFEKKENIAYIVEQYKVRFRDVFPYPFRSNHAKRWKTGDWTGDTDQMICIMKSLTKNELRCNVSDFARCLHKWVNKGFAQCGDKRGMAIGRTIGSVVSKRYFFNIPHEMSKQVWEDMKCSMAANGALMRTSVVSVANYSDLDTVVKNSIDFCRVTHYDPRCVVSCIFINTILTLMLQRVDEDYQSILDRAYFDSVEYLNQEHYDSDEFCRYAKTVSIDQLNLGEYFTIGYTYKCMGCGAYAFQKVIKHSKQQDGAEFDYKQIFDDIASEGGDADTNLTVVGAICGAYIGYKKLDAKWLNAMPNKQFLDEHVIEFLELVDGGFDRKFVRKFLSGHG